MPYHLKSLELNGYKTFATKSKFDFSGNITAVVGPNGSGKSNIADALRWVLGEQSYRLLRGRKTDDMIFAGSETRPKASMASVKVTFDNSDGWLPIDFTEVSVTRRAYRDGQNEYLINNQKVRLRDVTELLSKSGLSERTYTVIGQGLVDTALSLKAEERRKLFEEAAGIGLYRKRKDLSIRRLDTTKRNLERIKDILAELKPRLKSLERQSRKAQEYHHVRADLKEILREWYGFHWHLGQKELTHAQNIAGIQEKSLTESRQNQSSKDQELILVRNEVNSLRARLNSWHRQLAQIHTKREETSKNLAVNNERSRSLIERQSQMNLDNNSIREELELQQQRYEKIREKVIQFQAEKDDSENNGQIAKNNLEKLKSERSTAELALEQVKVKFTELNTRKIELSTLEKDLISRIDGHASSNVETKTALEQSRISLSEAENKLEEANEIYEKDNIKYLEIEKFLKENRDELNTSDFKFKENRSEYTKVESTLTRNKAQLEVLIQAEKSLAGYADGAKILLKASHDRKLLGTQGTLISHLKVSPEFEQAIASALGDYIDAVILKSNLDIDKALNILESNPAKASLLPISQIAPLSPIKMKKSRGVFGVASNLVDSSIELRPAVDLLLGQVVIVEDREIAKKLINSLDTGTRVVTLRGEIFYREGTILVNSDTGTAKLSRPRIRLELQEKIKKNSNRLDQLGTISEELENQSKIAREKIVKNSSDLDEQKVVLNKSRTKHQNIALETEQVKNMVIWHDNQLKTLDENVTQAKEHIENIKLEKEKILDNIKISEEKIKEHSSKLNGLELGELVDQVSYWEKQIAVSDSVLKDAQRNFDERKERLDINRKSLNELNEKKKNVDIELNKIVDSVSEMRTSETGISSQLTEIQILIDPSEIELQELEEKQLTLESEESKSRQALNMAERYHSQAQIEFVKRQETLTNLRQRIEDDFGLVEFEYEKEVSGPTPLPLGEKLVEKLQVVPEISDDLEQTLKNKRMQLRRMGSVNPEAHQEFIEVKERFQFMTTQVDDLEKAEKDIREVIAELDALMGREFRKTFEVVAMEFRQIFARLFRGGSAKLMLTDEENMDVSGVDIEARLPGKRMQRLALLSGGERAMTAVALVFALLKASPTPFCVMDEVDAALDEANISRLRELLEELSVDTQFVLITHNRNTVQIADLIYGITMGKDTASQTISLKLEEVDHKYSS